MRFIFILRSPVQIFMQFKTSFFSSSELLCASVRNNDSAFFMTSPCRVCILSVHWSKQLCCILAMHTHKALVYVPSVLRAVTQTTPARSITRPYTIPALLSRDIQTTTLKSLTTNLMTTTHCQLLDTAKRCTCLMVRTNKIESVQSHVGAPLWFYLCVLSFRQRVCVQAVITQK